MSPMVFFNYLKLMNYFIALLYSFYAPHNFSMQLVFFVYTGVYRHPRQRKMRHRNSRGQK